MRAHEGEDFGTIKPGSQGKWEWPFARMGIGARFDVHFEDRAIGAVTQLAYNAGRRLGKRFSVYAQGDYTIVECVDPNDTGRAAVEDKVVLEGGDGEDYLGVLVPPAQGNWAWPFAFMTPGQYFHVSHDDRSPERVRQLVMVRGKQESKGFSVSANDPEKLGYCRIEYLEAPRSTAQLSGPDVDYVGLNRLLTEHYGLSEPDIGVAGMSSATLEYEVDQISAPKHEHVVIHMDHNTLGAEFLTDRIIFTRLPQDTLCKNWVAGHVNGRFAVPSVPQDTFGLDEGHEHGIFSVLRAQTDAQNAKLDLLDD